jgi:hypothetical protein
MSKLLEIEYEGAEQYFSPLIGQKPWDVSIGHSHFVTMEFGNKVPQKTDFFSKLSRKPKIFKEHGEWHLWIYMCAWRLEQNDFVLAASEDNTDRIEKAIKVLEGLILENIEIKRPLLDISFYFENNLILKTFSVYSDESDECKHWMLFVPDGNVLVAGPADKLFFGDASHSE